MYDYAIIGAGYGGLAASALLQARGYKTLLLEAHATLGGCASFFRRQQFTFDVGATTFSGVLPQQPLGRLFSELKLQPDLVKLDPGMVIKLDDDTIIRHAETDKWINEAKQHFPNSAQREFWQRIFSLNEFAWEAVNISHRIPPSGISDLFALSRPGNIRYAALLPGLFRPLTALLAKYKLAENHKFRRFLDEQLLISTQNTSSGAPYLTAAMGLAYPSETYYPTGGMFRPALLLLRSFKASGGVAKFNQKVSRLEPVKQGYRIETSRGESYVTRGVVANVPIWNLAALFPDHKMERHFSRLAGRFQDSWGAFTLYFAIADRADLPTAYYQIHTAQPLPFCQSRSMFVSFSLRGDTAKAPQGWRTVTISTHTRAASWSKSGSDYAAQKDAVQAAMLAEFDRAFPEFSGAEKRFVAAGTPVTFERYTGRSLGYVGGIPHSTRNNPLFLPANATPFKDFYMVGDSVFPGQGVPAVALGALNIVARICENKRTI